MLEMDNTFNSPNNDGYNGAVVELEMKRADRVGKIIAVVSRGRIELLNLTAEIIGGIYQSEIRLYKTNNRVYDLYLLASSWTENNFVKITNTRNFTYDGSLVSSYIGTQVTPSRMLATFDVYDTVVSGISNPVTSNATYNAIYGHFIQIPSPQNVIRHIKIGIRGYNKGSDSVLIAFNCYSMWGVIREGQCFYRGSQYGVLGYSYTNYTEDNDAFFWLKISSWRTVSFISSKELYIMENTTAIPSGVTFSNPVQWT